MIYVEKINSWVRLLFPERKILNFELSLGKTLILFLVLWALFSVAGTLIPADGFVGFDWVHFWGQGSVPPFYPPWTGIIISLLSWPTLVGTTLAAVTTATILRARHPISVISALLALPLFWTTFLGQLEGIVVLGLLGLPWLTPLALVKPQISIFAFGAKRSYVLAFVIFLSLSILVWGLWPLRTLSTNVYYAEGRYAQDISLGLWGAFIALPLLWLSRGDMDMLMVGGAFMTPHLIPYNLLLVVPAIARLKPVPALIACTLSWLPFSANWLGEWGWWLGWLFIIWLWVNLALDRYPAFGRKRSSKTH